MIPHFILRPRAAAAVVLLCLQTATAVAQDPPADLEKLRRQVEELERRDAEKERELKVLRRRLDAEEPATQANDRPSDPLEQALEESEPDPVDQALDRALQESAPALGGTSNQALGQSGGSGTPSDVWSRSVGPVRLRLIDISFDALIAAGWSSERDSSIQVLQAGGHDPNRRGFTVQNIELSFAGAVDPYFLGEAHLIYFIDPEGESRFELEEAFFQTLALPFGFQLEGGQFFTEYGRINPRHPHQWEWQDQPIINSRLFGADGMRGPGFRLGWLSPLPFFSEVHFGMQNANGETMKSFLSTEEAAEEPFGSIGGRQFTATRDVRSFNELVYLARWVNAADLTDEWNFQLGVSALFGPNQSGKEGNTLIYGTDLYVKWRPTDSLRGWPFVSWQTEVSFREFRADSFLFDPDATPDSGDEVRFGPETLEDWGGYTQVLWGFTWRWIAGLRYEYATGRGDDLALDPAGGPPQVVSRGDDPFHNERHRISPLLMWYPSEFSRVRLQYNYDRATHLGHSDAHSVWLGVEIGFGVHPAHRY